MFIQPRPQALWLLFLREILLRVRRRDVARGRKTNSTLPVRLPASRDIPRRTRNSISRKKKQSERLGTRLMFIHSHQ